MSDAGDPTGYQVTHRKTGEVFGPYQTLKTALRKSDNIDNSYGGYISKVSPIYGSPSPPPIDPAAPNERRGGRVEGKKPRRRLDRSAKK